MNRMNVKVDRPEITDDQILKHKNFDQVVQAASTASTAAASGLTAIKLWIILGTVALAAPLTYLLMADEPVENESTAYAPAVQETSNEVATAKLKVDPPSKGQDIPYELFTVQNEKGGVITSASDSKISIPADCFQYPDGSPVEGAIEIQYREFHKPLDFFLSGIPMTYDSAGTNYHFESAGMLEILAFKDGQPVNIKPSQEIQVDLVSETAASNFNTYYFDTAAGKWSYEGQHAIESYEASSVSEATAMTPLPEPAKDLPIPVKPRKAQKDKFAFELAIDEEKFPELTTYENVLFEVDEEASQFEPDFYRIDWDAVEIAQVAKSENENCELRLIKEDTSFTVEAYPVYDAADYENAMAQYKELMTTYETRRKEDDKAEVRARTVIKQREQAATTNTLVESLVAQSGLEPAVRRTIPVPNIGIWNCDAPISLPPLGVDILAHFYDKGGNDLAYSNLYVANSRKNALFNLGQSSEARYFKGGQNTLWLVTETGEIAIAEKDAFDHIQPFQEILVFKLLVLDELEGLKQLRELLDS